MSFSRIRFNTTNFLRVSFGKSRESGLLWVPSMLTLVLTLQQKVVVKMGGVDDQAVKVVDIVDTFRLQEQPPFDKKQFVAYMKKYIKLLTPKLEGENQEIFKKNIKGATKFLLSKIKDLQLFAGESMDDDSTMVIAHYKEGATKPTFLYFAHALKEVKC